MEEIITTDQRTDEWFKSRLGRLTASRFGDLLTQPRSTKDKEAGIVSQTTKSYLIEKLSEVLTGTSREFDNEGMDWGTQTEQEAREFYEFQNIAEVEQTGFVVLKENPMVGCSPDGLVGEDGTLEIKCPFNTNNMVEYMFDGPIPNNYYAQIQGGLWILDRKWCDFVVYDPRIKNAELRMHVRRIYRDEIFIEKLKASVDTALKYYEAMLKRVGLTFEDVLNDKPEA